MNIQTLHQCNVSQKLNLDCFNDMVSKKDVIVFYGRCIDVQQQQLLQHKFSTHSLYFLISDKPELSNINYSDWLQLVKNCKNILTWQ